MFEMSNEALFELAKSMIRRDGGELRVSSLDIARYFERHHRNVIQSIENFLALNDDENFSLLNFQQTSYVDSQGKFQPSYNLTFAGFNAVVLAYTSKKAIRYRVQFVKAFDWMVKRLQGQNNVGPTPVLMEGLTAVTINDDQFMVTGHKVITWRYRSLLYGEMGGVWDKVGYKFPIDRRDFVLNRLKQVFDTKQLAALN